MKIPRLVSVNVWVPREVTWDGETETTGFLKAPGDGPVVLASTRLSGLYLGLEEGVAAAGDHVARFVEHPDGLRVADPHGCDHGTRCRR